MTSGANTAVSTAEYGIVAMCTVSRVVNLRPGANRTHAQRTQLRRPLRQLAARSFVRPDRTTPGQPRRVTVKQTPPCGASS
jgi:hypothetical protein